MEPHEAHRGSQNAAAPGREIAGKDRCAVGCHQDAAAAGQVILHGTECSLYYRLVSNEGLDRAAAKMEVLLSSAQKTSIPSTVAQLKRWPERSCSRGTAIISGDPTRPK